MSLPNRSTKLKVAFGYILLTALLFISIGYIYQEMKSLSGTGDDEAILSQRRHVTNQIIGQLYQAEVIGQSLSTGQIEQYYRYQRAMKQATTALDSLRTLLTDSIQLARLDTVGMLFMDKERNMRNLLKAIQDGGTDILYKQHIDELIAQQDSLLSLPHVRKKVITHTNSYIIRKKPKSFFKRLGEVFSPGKADSTQVNNVIQEEYTDTLTEAYSPADTVVTMLKNIQSRVTDTQQERMEMVNRRTQSLRLSGLKLSQKVNQLLSTIEEEEQALAQNKHIQEEYIRQSSIRTVAGIAIVAVVLAIFFLVLIWRDITRSNHYRRELEKAKRRAEDLLAAREKLMLTITHDIKAPVGSILGYTDLLERMPVDVMVGPDMEDGSGNRTELERLARQYDTEWECVDRDRAETFGEAQAQIFAPVSGEVQLVHDYLITPRVRLPEGGHALVDVQSRARADRYLLGPRVYEPRQLRAYALVIEEIVRLCAGPDSYAVFFPVLQRAQDRPLGALGT